MKTFASKTMGNGAYIGTELPSFLARDIRGRLARKTLNSLLIIALLLPLCSLPTRTYPGNPVATDQLDPGTHDNLKSNSTETNNREIYLARYQTWCDATIVSLTLLPWLMFTTHDYLWVGCGAKRKQCRNSCVTFRHLLTWGKFINTVK